MKRLFWPALAGLSAFALGCTTGGVTFDEQSASSCVAPQKGARYTVCGRLTTGVASGNVFANGAPFKGGVDAVNSASSTRYQVKGGTFHASH